MTTDKESAPTAISTTNPESTTTSPSILNRVQLISSEDHNQQSSNLLNRNDFPSSSSSSKHGKVKKKANKENPQYGWCSITPNFIQFLVNRKAFLFVFCITCVLQGTFHTYFVAVITTLEKLFSIPSQVTGTLMMGSEIGQVSSALFLPYFVGQGHRPRWMAIGSSLFSLATLLCASPHILIPLSLKLKSTQDSQYCDALIPSSTEAATTTTTASLFMSNETMMTPVNFPACEPQAEEQNPHFILFPIIFLSLFTIGLGQTAVYTLGIPFLDDNVASRDSPIYFSITIGVRILGPVLGFILGSLCTRLYIYPHITPDYDPTDPRWLGAWWLGMLLISSCLFLTSLVMYGFPATLSKRKKSPINDSPGTEEEFKPINDVTEEPMEKQDQDQGQRQETNTVQQQPKLKNFPRTIKRLLTNKILILRTFSCVFHLLPISGLYTFLPKYLESQFRLAAFQANMVTGIAGILVMGIGIFSSGVFIRRKEPSARGIAIWVAGAAGIYSAGMVALMFVGCGAVDGNRGGGGGEIGGMGGGDPVSLSDFSLRVDGDFGLPNCDTGKCVKCSESIYSPICGSDNLVYFSPCHAGCSKINVVKTDEKRDGTITSKITYTNCTCISSLSDHSQNEYHDGPEQTATNGMCPVSCDLFPLYLTIFMTIVLVHSTSEVGSMLLTLRCVEPRDKAMALGLIQCAIGIFGNVPCPVIYGTVVDSACIVWGLSGGGECGGDGISKRGHCWVYDSTSFRIYFHGTTAFLMFIAFIIDIVIVFHANSINIGTNENDGGGGGRGDVDETIVQSNPPPHHHNNMNHNNIPSASPISPKHHQSIPNSTRVVSPDKNDSESLVDNMTTATNSHNKLLESSPLLLPDNNEKEVMVNGATVITAKTSPSSSS